VIGPVILHWKSSARIFGSETFTSTPNSVGSGNCTHLVILLSVGQSPHACDVIHTTASITPANTSVRLANLIALSLK